ncbi:putative PKS/NRPS-like protein biosynthetic cluster [Botryosphaeria dothidea]
MASYYHPSQNEPIAVVGSGCRFPGESNTPSCPWELLRRPRDLCSKIPTTRFNPDAFYHPDNTHHGTSNVKHAYLLSEDYRHFDASFFCIKPVEAESIDPQQRLLLETVYESIEAAGMRVEDIMLTYISTATARSIMSNHVSYARGDGVAAVVLKTLSAALADGDHIECLIRETGVNQNGRTRGITMTSATAQAALIRDTYTRAGLDLRREEDRPQYFEAHGTGTPTGDPLEAEAISSALFPKGYAVSQRLPVGSIKIVIGHTGATAGLAALLKASLATQSSTIAPNLLFENLNLAIAPFYKDLDVPTSSGRWPILPPGVPRRASVNSFGFGGTNAHVIDAKLDEIKRDKDASVAVRALASTSSSSKTPLLGVFTGQGAQFAGMGKELFGQYEIVRRITHRMDKPHWQHWSM